MKTSIIVVVLLLTSIFLVSSLDLTEDEIQFYIKQRLRDHYEKLHDSDLSIASLEAEIQRLSQRLSSFESSGDGVGQPKLHNDPINEIISSDFTISEKGTFLPTQNQNILSQIVANKIAWKRLQKEKVKQQQFLTERTQEMYQSFIDY